MLGPARERAAVLSQRGALYPWRTINGEEASAYYAAGTAQYHINAAIVFALRRYLEATGDVEFLANEGAEILVETARLWADLGFYASNGDGTFHIHRVTGPDEYTTVVNDNFYTNVMARFNLRYAARTVRFLAEWNPRRVRRAAAAGRTCELDELDAWDAAADAMFIPYDDDLGINPQDSTFLELEPWDWDGTPPDKFPLLLHFHPLVIYRHQVLKQADVVLAMFLRGEHFTRRTEAAQLRLLRPDHDRRLVAVGVRAGDRGRRGRLRRAGARLLPIGRSTSISATSTATPPTGCTSPPAAGSGRASCTGSPAWSTTASDCASRRACPPSGIAWCSTSAATARCCASSSTMTAARCRSPTAKGCR